MGANISEGSDFYLPAVLYIYIYRQFSFLAVADILVHFHAYSLSNGGIVTHTRAIEIDGLRRDDTLMDSVQRYRARSIGDNSAVGGGVGVAACSRVSCMAAVGPGEFGYTR